MLEAYHHLIALQLYYSNTRFVYTDDIDHKVFFPHLRHREQRRPGIVALFHPALEPQFRLTSRGATLI